jgi:ubiquinone/menaquinone biosynthesis C-methylase UbiE
MNFLNERERITIIYDKYIKSKKYNQKWSSLNMGNKKIHDELKNQIIKMLKEKKIEINNKKILDVGCASGNKVTMLIQIGFEESNIYGIDIREESVNKALMNFPSSHFSTMDARRLLYPDDEFDFVNISTLYSSINSEKNRQKVTEELLRVLKSDGHIIYYDLRYYSPFNPNVRPMKTLNIEKLFYGLDLQKKRITLLPPLARRLGIFTNILYPILSKISFLNSHYLYIIKKINN